MSFNPANRPGSIQAIANDHTHPAQPLCHGTLNDTLYWWLNFWVHLGQVRGLHLPVQYDYTQKKNLTEANLKQLNSKFEISRPPPARYTFSGQDLLSCPEEVIAFHVPCMQGEPNRWRLRFKDEWKCDVLHKEGVKPGVVFPIESRRWIVQMYTQYEVGPPSQRESIQRRLCWFEKCLDELAEFMEDEGLNRVAMPAFIGSTSKTQRSWSPYRQVLEEWHEKHPQIVVVLYNF